MNRFAAATYAPDAGYPTQWDEPVTINPTGTQTTGSQILGGATRIVGAVVDIFGRRVNPQPVVQSPPTPLWVWIAIPVAGIVLLGIGARALRKKKSMGRYRRSRR